MKNIVLATVVLALFTTFGFAQQKPTLEKQGDLVKVVYYHHNGTIAQTGFFKEGKLHGEWKQFNTKGNKTALAHYNKGEKVGKWFFWIGNTLNEVNYEDSRIASVHTWKDNGLVAISK